MTNRKWNKEFREWQRTFYQSKQWKQTREQIRNNKKMRCDNCHKLIKGKSIVDHIKEITPENKEDYNIILNINNLQLLCLKCHNSKTFAEPVNFDLDKRKDINLF